MIKRESSVLLPKQAKSNVYDDFASTTNGQVDANQSRKILQPEQQSITPLQRIELKLGNDIISQMQSEAPRLKEFEQSRISEDLTEGMAKLNRLEIDNILECLITRVRDLSTQGGSELERLERARQDILQHYDRIISPTNNIGFDTSNWQPTNKAVEANYALTYPVVNASTEPAFDQTKWLLNLQPSNSMVPVEEAAQALGIVDRTVRRIIQKTNIPSELRTETVNVNLTVERLYVDLPTLRDTYENLPRPGRPKKDT